MDKTYCIQDTHAYQVLTNLISHQSAPQNILLTGSDLSLKAELTTFYLQNRFCETTQAKPCQSCQSCRFIANKQHPDVYWYEIGAKFGKDEMRQLQSKMAESALMQKSRAYVIEQLDLLTPQAQNAWLKFLEEPYDDVYCIAWVENENQILPTVKSRFLSLFVHNQSTGEKRAHIPLVTKFIEQYKNNIGSADLLLLIEKNMKTADEFSLFLETLLYVVVHQVDGAGIDMMPLISHAQKMIGANVPQDQVAVYFCLNVYSKEVFE